MRVAVLSDIHANLPALDAVLNDLRAFSPKQIWCLGDVVGYGPFPNECVERVSEICRVVIAGNHERAVIDDAEFSLLGNVAKFGITLLRQGHLARIHRELIAKWHYLPYIPSGARDWTVVHATPSDPLGEYLTSTIQAKKNFNYFGTRYCLGGHTHVPRIFRLRESDLEVDKVNYSPSEVLEESRKSRKRKPLNGLKLEAARYMLNPGSVGLPNDRDVRAAYLLLETSKPEILLRRVPYPVQDTIRKMRESSHNDNPAVQTIIRRLETAIGDYS